MSLPRSPATAFPRQPTAVVTGAASARGIGRATAHRLAAHGWAVALLDLDLDAVIEVAADISSKHRVPSLGLGVDISDEAAVGAAVGQIQAELPQIVGLVNNAGVSSPIPFLEVTSDEWHRVMNINVNGTFYVTRAIAPIMAEHRLGRIVNVSSASAERGGGVYGRTAYAASKAALLGMSRTLARELGPHGITANSIAPGSIDTDIMGGRLDESRLGVLLRELPVGRVGTVHDVANLIHFLLGPESGYITGATYDVNGGSHIA